MAEQRVRVVSSWIAGPLALALVLASVAAWSAQLKNIRPTAHGIPAGVPSERIIDAIILAGDEAGWTLRERRADSVSLSIAVNGRHGARVRVGFDDERFWIDYETSVNLGYDPKDKVIRRQNERKVIRGPHIHPNYNVWVKQLADRIASRAKAIALSDVKVEDVIPAVAAAPDEPVEGEASGVDAPHGEPPSDLDRAPKAEAP